MTDYLTITIPCSYCRQEKCVCPPEVRATWGPDKGKWDFILYDPGPQEMYQRMFEAGRRRRQEIDAAFWKAFAEEK